MSEIHVLVVDDSAVVRQVMTAILGSEMTVTTAADPIIAMAKMEARWPDVAVLDLEMPRMDGLTFLAKLMKETPLPVVICSSLTESSSELTMRALQLGAVDVVLKPRVRVAESLTDSAIELIDAVRAAAQAKVGKMRALSQLARPTVLRPAATAIARGFSHPVIAIGASTGGTEVLKQVLDSMPSDAPAMVIVQHMPEHFTAAFARRLNETSAMEVREAISGDVVSAGTALIAPGNRHLSVRWRERGVLGVELHDAPLVNRHRPSVDVLFSSVAKALGTSAIGVLMTGMGRDGAKGLLEMKKGGALTIAQDEDSSIVFGMPRAAIELGAVGKVVAADRIAIELIEAIRGHNP